MDTAYTEEGLVRIESEVFVVNCNQAFEFLNAGINLICTFHLTFFLKNSKTRYFNKNKLVLSSTKVLVLNHR